jgi:hypothetical protein
MVVSRAEVVMGPEDKDTENKPDESDSVPEWNDNYQAPWDSELAPWGWDVDTVSDMSPWSFDEDFGE